MGPDSNVVPAALPSQLRLHQAVVRQRLVWVGLRNMKGGPVSVHHLQPKPQH